MAQPAAKPPTARKAGTTAYFTVALLLLVIVVMLPFAITSVFTDITEQSATVFQVDTSSETLPVRADIHMQVIGVNEWDGTASIRVSTNQTCQRACPWGDRYLFVSVFGDTNGTDDERPTTQIVTLPADARDVTQVIALPLFGDPIRYPFDSYRLAVGVVVDRLLPDGTVQTLSVEEARRYLSVSIQGRIPRMKMEPPVTVDPATLRTAENGEPYAVIELLTFQRPLYLKVLTVLLVLLVTAAAAYAVFMRPLDQLINSGALVLGVWGIRSILLGTAVPGVTAVDLALSVVILFLLATITVRTLYLLEESSAVRLLRRQTKQTGTAETPPATTPPDHVPDQAAASPAPSPAMLGEVV
jgi:hypothetical protein